MRSVKVNPIAIKWLVGCDYGTSTVMSWGLYAKYPDGTVLKVKEYYYDAQKMKVQRTDRVDFANSKLPENLKRSRSKILEKSISPAEKDGIFTLFV